MLGARHPDLVGRLMIVDALPFYTLMIDPAATSETASQRAIATRDWILAQSPEEFVAFQKTSIARLAKTEAVGPLWWQPGSVLIAKPLQMLCMN